MSSQTVSPKLVVFLLVICSVLGLAGTDLVLPAVPFLPAALGGTAAASQLVLATFVTGGAIGLLLFGELGARYDQRKLLLISLAGYGLTSLLAVFSTNITMLITIRFFQGVASAAPAVFAPGIIRVLFSEKAALRAIGILGSVESLAPALAPIAGVALFNAFGWQSSFTTIALIAVIMWLVVFSVRRSIPNVHPEPASGGYLGLLSNPVYMRYALSQALTLGGLLVFVFGAPAVITQTMGGTLTHFIVMQVAGITTFIIAANSAQWLVERFGSERVILFGSGLSSAGGIGILIYSLLGSASPSLLPYLFVPMNLGLGLRGPPGFYAAVVASDGNDARGAALLILLVLLTTAGGTAIAAPMILDGLMPLAAVSVLISVLSLFTLMLLRAPASNGQSPVDVSKETGSPET
ncbi:MAG: MFS transporter [Pseudomonadota bacterium]